MSAPFCTIKLFCWNIILQAPAPREEICFMKSTVSKMLLILHVFSQIHHCIALHFNGMELHITAEDLLEMWILELVWSLESSQLSSCAPVPSRAGGAGDEPPHPRVCCADPPAAPIPPLPQQPLWPCCSSTSAPTPQGQTLL